MIPRPRTRNPLYLLLLAAVVWLGGGALDASPAPRQVVTPPPRSQFQIYLLMGQSNMAGRDTRKLADQVDNPHILALDPNGQWVVARDPIFAQRGRTKPGAGPGIPFAQTLLRAHPGITIGLVPCAVGGTSLGHWVRGADLYERALRMARVAARSGVISGVLWQQGESDTTREKDAATYAGRLARLLGDLRQDLGQPDLPIVVGQLGGFLSPHKYPYVDRVRAAIRRVPGMVPHVGYADSAGLGDRGDGLHFSADAQQVFGQRFAREMLLLQERSGRPEFLARPVPALTVAVWPPGRMPGRGAARPEHLLPDRGDYAQRLTDISRPTLSVFPAPGAPASAPAMIVCPGGGYSYLVVNKEGSEIAAWLNTAGITAVVLHYRVPHNREGALQDIQRALSLTRANAAAWHIDPHHLGVIGFSAGGHLAAAASRDFDQRAYAPIDGVDQQSCRPDLAVLVYPAYLEQDDRLAPDVHLNPEMPPTLIVHSRDDRVFSPGSILYHAALDRAGRPNTLLMYQTGGHGYGLRCTREAKAWPEAALAWLRRNGVRRTAAE